MGGDSKSHVWNVRVTITERNTLDKILAFCKEHLYVKLACKESADALVARDHVHIACVSLDKQLVRSTVKGHLDKFLDLAGNEDYSMTTPKDQPLGGLYDYICKGKNEIETENDWSGHEGAPDIIHNFLNTIDVKQHHHNYWTLNKKLEAETKAEYKKAAKDARRVKQVVITKLVDKYEGQAATVENLDLMVTDILTEYKGDVNDQSLFTILQSISWNIDPEKTNQRAAARMRSRLLNRISSNTYI